ncbi:MAG: efflux RND transporter permease subunit [Eubacteriales bacterium]|nr:efflux RND transporter permease subunit [Eubacteriales bacterium]
MNRLTRLALKRPVSALLAVLALAVFGFSSLTTLRLELMPDMDMPMMIVYAVYPGADSESVDDLVTSVIEDSVSSLSGVDSVTSQSAENMSMVLLQYDYDKDTNDAYLDLRAAIDALRQELPDDCQDPVIMEMDMNAMPSITYSVSTTDGSDALAFVNEDVVPELEALGTVAEVQVSGGQEQHIRVLLDQEALDQYGLTMSAVAQYIQATDFTIPLGSLTQGSQSISAISTADNETVQAIRDIPLYTSAGSLIRLEDVADVNWSVKNADSVARYNGEDTVSLSMTKNQSASTIGMVNDVREVMDEIAASNDNVVVDVSMDNSELIVESLSSVGSTLVMGVILSMIVLFLFFGDWKASVIVGCSMPISLLLTVIVMALMGFSLNIMTLGGLVIAIGMMVDSSSVVLESCFRAKDRIPDYHEAALQGASEVAASIVASTITTVVVYLPLCFADGLTGQIFMQLGLTIVFSLLASLISAVALVPLFFKMYRPTEKKELKINRILERVTERYEKMERKLLCKKKRCLAVAVLLLIASFWLLSMTNMVLMPSMDEGMISVEATFRPGTRLEVVDEEIRSVEEMVASHGDVESYTLTASDGSATITATLKDDRDMTSQEVVDQWVAATQDLTDMQLDITMTSQMSYYMSADSGASLTVESVDLEDVKDAAEAIKDASWQIPGVINVSTDMGDSSTQVRVVIDPLSAMSRGMTPVQAAGSLYSMISGTEAMTVTSDGNEYSVDLEFPEGTYDNASSLMDASVGGVPLSEIATLEYTDASQTIMKQDGKYTVTVTATCLSDDTDDVQEAMDALLETVELPDSVELSSSLMEEMQDDMYSSMGLAIAAAMFLVFLVMAMQFESPKFSLMVMLSIPFSLIGAFGLVFLSGTDFSMVGLMGVLTLVGTVVNNGILYVDGVNMLRRRMSVEDALIQSGKTRLRPILITTLTTVFAMVPNALGIGGRSAVMMQGMSLVIIGGLVASTILILVLMPVFYLMVYGTSKKERRDRRFLRKLRRAKKPQSGQTDV